MTAARIGLIFAGLGAAHAEVVRVRVAAVEQELVQLREMELRLDESGPQRSLHLVAARLTMPSVALDGQLDWRCALQRESAESWACTGPVTLDDAATGKLAAQIGLRIRDGYAQLEIAHGEAHATVQIPWSAQVPVKATLGAIPVAWMDRLAKRYWPDGRPAGGRLGADIELAPDGTIGARYRLSDLAFDSHDGSIAGDRLDVAGSLDVHAGTQRLEIRGELRGGEVLVGPFYAKWPHTPIRFLLDAHAGTSGAWVVRRFDWDDPGVLALHANATLDPKAADPLQRLDIELDRAVLPAAADRYAATWLAAEGYGDLALSGTFGATIGFDGKGVDRVALRFDAVDARDAAGRFGVRGIDGAIDWSVRGTGPGTRLAWDAAQLYRVELAPGTLAFTSQNGVLALAGPSDIGVFGGRLVLQQLALRPRADAAERFGAGFALVDIDLSRLSAAFGWPAFAGTLGGAVPHIGYADEVLALDGGLLLNVFDGTVNVTRMRLERPFGIAPSLAADVAISDLDLEELTGVFSFGEITGRLDGRIDALRLLDWKPVAFDASLRGDSGGRISQRAVGSLSAVGGAGIGGGIQGMALKLFDTFGYARLGLDCRLADNVCHMDGIGRASGNGYTIVEGSGLPRIHVVGFQHDVDWPTLVARLVAATQGQGPEIR